MLSLSIHLANDLPPGRYTLSPLELQELAAEGARAVEVEVKNSFASMGRQSNSQSYWQQAADSVQVMEPMTASGNISRASVVIPHKGVRLHLLGGTVRPKGKANGGADALLIPFDNSPLKRKALSELNIPEDEIRVFSTDKSKPAVLYHIKPRKRKNKAGDMHDITPLGVLLKQVTIKPKPEVLPTAEKLSAAVHTAGQAYLDNR